jgi:hypothetical protein
MKQSFYSHFIQSLFKTASNNQNADNRRQLGLELLEKRELLSVNTRQLLVDDFSDFTQETSVVADNQTSTFSEESQSVSLSELEEDDIYGAFLESNLDVNLLESEWHNISSQSSQASPVNACGFGGGSVSVEGETIEVVEGIDNYAVVNISRTDVVADKDAMMTLDVHYQIVREITYFDETTSTSTSDGYLFIAPGSSHEYHLFIGNDFVPEYSEVITFTILSAGHVHWSGEYEISDSEIVINVIDNDNWKVQVETTDDTATERLSDVAPDYGEYTFTRYHDIDNVAGDTNYVMYVYFDMIYDNANPYSANGGDYQLRYADDGTFLYGYTYNNDEETITRYRYTIVFPDDQTEIVIQLVPNFDWQDEGELFNPTGENTPKDDLGEKASLEIVNATWTNKRSDYDAIDHDYNEENNTYNDKAQIEIKDGAIIQITTDSNNDGTINTNDNLPSVKNNSSTPGRIVRANGDDDDTNGEIDKWQRPEQFDTAMNPAALAGTAPSVTVQNEDDLAETRLYVWVETLTKTDGTSLYFDVYSVFPTDLVMWTASSKGSRIHRGVVSNNRITEQTRLTTLSNASGQNVFTRTIYMEANNSVTGTVTLQAMPVPNTNASAGSDSVKITGYIFDLDIDSDNNNDNSPSLGTRVMPERSNREENYEAHDYGLGKIIIPNWGDSDNDQILDCWDGYQQGNYNQTALGNGVRSELFYPIVLEIPQGIALADMRIKIDYLFASVTPTNGTNNPSANGDGTIRIWTKNRPSARNAITITAGGDLVMPTGTSMSYTPAQLGFTDSNRVIVLYVEGITENAVTYYEEDDWENVYQNTKPTTSIKVTLEYNNIFLAEDEICYIVSHSNPEKSKTASFWYNVLAHEEFRQAFASSAIYNREDLPRFGMQLLQYEQLTEMEIDDDTKQLLLNKIPGDVWTTIAGQEAPGFNAGIYYDHITGKAILTFAGSDDCGDWITDAAQGLASSSQQYAYAMDIAQELLILYSSGTAYTSLAQTTPGKPTEMMITGHSLGGGLASTATIVSGFVANTFNAAGLSDMTKALADSARIDVGYFALSNPSTIINAYITENDILDAAQWVIGLQALGNRIILEDEYLFTAFYAHIMSQIFYGLMNSYNS